MTGRRSDPEFARWMRQQWGRLAVFGVAATTVLAVLLTLGVVPSMPGTGPAMGFLAALTVVSTACWVHWRGETSGGGQ